MSWYAGKGVAREYLKKLNANGKVCTLLLLPTFKLAPYNSPKLYQVLEYTLFQTGLFLDYLASPYQTAKHVAPLDIIFNYEKCQAIVVDGHEDATITLTTAADAAAVIAKAIGSDKEWPEISGVQGNRATLSQVIKLGERLRGTLHLQYSPNA